MKYIFKLIIIFLLGWSGLNAQEKIAGYEYWVNDDFSSKTIIQVTSEQQLLINQSIPTTSLNQGLNVLNFRAFDNIGIYSSVVSHFFYKTSMPENNPNSEILEYEYWLNNNYANAVFVNTPDQHFVNINELISMSSLNNGVHVFNIRSKDNNGLWSSVASYFFYKTPEQIVMQNTITGYRYWFNSDFANAVNVSLTPTRQINIIDNLNLTQLPNGNHDIHFQFKDANGNWSVVIEDIIEKSTLVGIHETTFENEIIVYPNPTDGFVKIDMGEELSVFTVSINDVSGRLVERSTYKNTRTIELNLKVQPGIYLLTIKSEFKMTTIRLIKD